MESSLQVLRAGLDMHQLFPEPEQPHVSNFQREVEKGQSKKEKRKERKKKIAKDHIVKMKEVMTWIFLVLFYVP